MAVDGCGRLKDVHRIRWRSGEALPFQLVTLLHRLQQYEYGALSSFNSKPTDPSSAPKGSMATKMSCSVGQCRTQFTLLINLITCDKPTGPCVATSSRPGCPGSVSSCDAQPDPVLVARHSHVAGAKLHEFEIRHGLPQPLKPGR